MSQCPAKAWKPSLQPRSHGGWYMGSHHTVQALVEPTIGYVQPAYERMDSVRHHGKGVSSVQWPGADPYAPACAQATPARHRARIATPVPPPPAVAVGAHPQIFPTFS